MTDTDRDFFRWTRDKQGAFSKNLKQELDKKLPIEGGTLTGPIEISSFNEELEVKKLLSIRVKMGDPIRHDYTYSIGMLTYSPIVYGLYHNTLLFGICHNLGIFPANGGKNFTLGYYGARWPNVYANKLNNGGDIEIPEKAGTMALLSDIEDILKKYNLIPETKE